MGQIKKSWRFAEYFEIKTHFGVYKGEDYPACRIKGTSWFTELSGVYKVSGKYTEVVNLISESSLVPLTDDKTEAQGEKMLSSWNGSVIFS